MSDGWAINPSSKYGANIIGWQDIEGHRHNGTPEAQDSFLDGLIVRITNHDDPEDTKVITVFKVSKIPDLDEWIRNIQVIASYYGFELVYGE